MKHSSLSPSLHSFHSLRTNATKLKTAPRVPRGREIVEEASFPDPPRFCRFPRNTPLTSNSGITLRATAEHAYKCSCGKFCQLRYCSYTLDGGEGEERQSWQRGGIWFPGGKEESRRRISRKRIHVNTWDNSLRFRDVRARVHIAVHRSYCRRSKSK